MNIGAERAAAPHFDGAEDQAPAEESWPPADLLAGSDDLAADPAGSGRPLLGAALILLTLAWLSACALALYWAQPPLTMINAVSWLATISVPVVLFGLIWLIFGRTSRLETERFTRAVAQMRGEAESLDRVLADVAERIASNRSQLTDESARLMKLGEEASDRLGRVTHFLARESGDLERKSGALESAAAQARVDMGVLLADLPHAELAARSFSETLREAGVTAHERSRALEAQLSAIAARAQDADVATGGAAERLSAHIARIETSAGVAAEQLDQARARLDAAVDGALTRTTEAVEATRGALDAQAQGLLATVEQGRARFTEAGADAGRQLAERIDAAGQRLVQAGEASGRELDERLEAAQRRLIEAGARSGDELTGRLASAQGELLATASAGSVEAADRIGAAHRDLVEAASVSSLMLAERLGTARRQLVEETNAASLSIEQRLGAAQGDLVQSADSSGRAVAERLDAARRQLVEAGEQSGREVTERLHQAQQQLIEASLDSSRQLAERLDASRQRLLEAGEQASAQVTERLGTAQQLFAGAGSAASERIAAQLHEAQQLVAAIGGGIAAQEEASRALIGALGRELAGLDERLAALGTRTDAQSTQMATALASLRDATATLRQEVDAGTQEAAALVGRAQSMGGALDAATARLRDELPPALVDVEERALAAREAALSLAEPVQAAQAAAAEGAARLAEAEASVTRQRAALEGLLTSIADAVGGVEDRLRSLSAAVNSADDSASLLVRETGPELVEALTRVREAARVASTHARDAISAAIPESAATLADAVRRAMDASVTDTVREQIAGLDAAAQHAALAARKASERLTRQLLTLGEGAAALEQRIDEEKALREEQDRGSMSRRVALLIESLNSTAIDVTKILSNDVTDTAWNAYLKGDRGVFTRRAVRLLATGEAREIARHYDEEPEFREQVNRYIHDFETMLRRVMNDGEGDTLSVALLSSDMGKLYVALAQAIDRLRR